jgi:NAD(P)-dependent dehydrogenase (short-subunit alcohol dehydrogenase family)
LKGICHELVKKLLGGGCSVIIADLKLRPEAEITVNTYPQLETESRKPFVVFHKTDVSDWSQLSSLWEASLQIFPQVDIVVNGAAIYEPPSSTFWNPPGISLLSEDDPDAKVGQYKSFAVNTTGPIRLAQIAIDYWMQNRAVKGNLLWVASMGGYVHSIQTPFYYASKAAIVSFVKSLQALNMMVGIRNSAVCPGAVRVSLDPLVQSRLLMISSTDPSLRSGILPRQVEEG